MCVRARQDTLSECVQASYWCRKPVALTALCETTTEMEYRTMRTGCKDCWAKAANHDGRCHSGQPTAAVQLDENRLPHGSLDRDTWFSQRRTLFGEKKASEFVFTLLQTTAF